MKLIIGLGNPGDRYMNNRRNIGFKIIDVLANNMDIKIKTKKKKSLLGRGIFEQNEVILLKPQTFIDLSGEAVLYIASFLRVPIQAIIVIHDDYLLPFGTIRFAKGPVEMISAGLKSITESLKSDKYIRIRVGVGPGETKTKNMQDDDIARYLLEDFNHQESMNIINVINDAEAALRTILTQDIDDALSRYKLGISL